MLQSKNRTWDNIENDLLSMIMYFYRNSGPNSYQTFQQCAEETGVPVSTVKYYVHHYNVDRQRWFLQIVANKYGYNARYFNGPRIKVYVERKKTLNT